MFNPYDPAFLADRYPTYRKLRDEAPVLEMPFGATTLYVLSRYEHVSKVLKNGPARVRESDEPASNHLGDGRAAWFNKMQLVLMDPPHHTRIRALVAPSFNPDTIATLTPFVEDLIEKRLDWMAERDEIDLIADYAAYIPASTITHILGIPHDEWPKVIGLVQDFLYQFSPFPLDAATLAKCDSACDFYHEYFGRYIDARRDDPPGGIVGALFAAEEAGDRLSRDELIMLLHTFLNAGYETTMSALGAGVHGLLTQRDQWRKLCATPHNTGMMFEELLRWEAPVHFVRRFLADDLTIEGVTIRADQPVLLALASANRDERKFERPDAIDGDRPAIQHLSFGGGRHFCIGAPLAKLEARLGLAGLARRFPNMELIDANVEREPNLLFPGIKSMRVRLNGN